MAKDSGKAKYQLLERLRDEEYAALEADIDKRGVLVPVEKDEDGNTLDGHHREEIAQRLGKPYETITRTFETEQEKREHVIKLNLARRHLEAHEWGGLFKQLLTERGVKRGQGSSEQKKRDQSETVSDVSRELGVDDRTARNRIKAHDEFEKLSPKERKAVTNREITVKKTKAVKRRKKTQADEAKAAAGANSEKSKPWAVTDQQAVIACDALITDPPYGILDEPWEPGKLEEFTREWATRWADCGAGLVAVFWSQRHLWGGRRWFDDSLTNDYEFQQLLIWHYPNNKSPQSRQGFKQTWEPVFLYRRDDCEREISVGGGEWGKDLTDFDCHTAAVPQGNFNDENMKQHPAQKPVSVMKWLVNAMTEPGHLVCDPFCGSGTTGVAALQLGRRFCGIETDANFLEIAKGRIAKYGKAAIQ